MTIEEVYVLAAQLARDTRSKINVATSGLEPLDAAFVHRRVAELLRITASDLYAQSDTTINRAMEE